ncbi:hypothetical protein KC354_g17326 [Hortaea werneckii]|nr:hypothetical protein KC354_g17326 [Hortaea werneckii]
MRTQLLNIEQTTGHQTLVNWWDAWLADFSVYISRVGQDWAYEALQESLLLIQQHNRAVVAAGLPALKHTAVVMAQLGEFATSIKHMVAPALPEIPLLPAPGGSKRDLDSEEYGSVEDIWNLPPAEVDLEVWERSMLEVVIDRESAGPHLKRVSHGHAHAHAPRNGHGHS